MKQKHFSLLPNTLVELLLMEKMVVHRLACYRGLNVSALEFNLWSIVMACVGLPLNQVEKIAPDYLKFYLAEYGKLEASVLTLQQYVNHLNQQFHDFHLDYPHQSVLVMKRELALVYILAEDFNWKHSLKNLKSCGIKFLPPDSTDNNATNTNFTDNTDNHGIDLNGVDLNTVNLLPIVFAELGKEYRPEYDDEIARRTPTDSASEYLEAVDWIQHLKT